jgi:hypothetical protein
MNGMKNARTFFLQVFLYSGTFCFLKTCMASCNSAVTECEQLKTAATCICQDEILEWSLRIHHALFILSPLSCTYLHMFGTHWATSVSITWTWNWLMGMELHCWFCHAFSTWQMSWGPYISTFIRALFHIYTEAVREERARRILFCKEFYCY